MNFTTSFLSVYPITAWKVSKYGEYSVRMQEDTDQKNFVFGHFTQVHFTIEVTFPGFGKKLQTNLGLFVKCC